MNTFQKPMMNKQRILLIEDTWECQQLVRAVLTHYGYDVCMADDGEQGVKLARTLSPDLILMDIHLPGIDGLEAVRQIKAVPALISVPVVALTAADEAADFERAMAAGCAAYLGKPFSPSKLVDIICQLLEGAATCA